MEPAARGFQGSCAEGAQVTSKVFLSLRVPADPLRAFEVFTQEIGLWWQPSGLFQVSAAGDWLLAWARVPAGDDL